MSTVTPTHRKPIVINRPDIASLIEALRANAISREPKPTVTSRPDIAALVESLRVNAERKQAEQLQAAPPSEPKEPYIPTPDEIAYEIMMADVETLNRQTMFVTRPALEWSRQARLTPEPKSLWGDSLWFEHEVACLFADTNLGKSILAVQIAEDIARRGARVLYFDFEMTAKQFQMRYTNPVTHELHEFSKNFMRVEINPEIGLSRDVVNIAKAIRGLADTTKANVLIIDNLSWLCNEAENGEAAGELMQILTAMKREKNLSILVLAHTPKIAAATPLTTNTLAGSKKIANFMDSIFALGRDRTALPHGRYIKQIKVRSAPLTFHEGNVLRFRIERVDSMLKFVKEEETGIEATLIAEDTTGKAVREQRNRQVLDLRREGLTIAQIAEQLGMSNATVGRIVKTMINS